VSLPSVPFARCSVFNKPRVRYMHRSDQAGTSASHSRIKLPLEYRTLLVPIVEYFGYWS
jgi:hypothetical protein